VRREGGRTGARDQQLGRGGGARAARRRHRARQRVHADPLERPDGVRCARGRGGEPGGRPGLGRAGIQAHAGAHRTLRRELVRLHPQPRRTAAAEAANWTRIQGSGLSSATSWPAASRSPMRPAGRASCCRSRTKTPTGSSSRTSSGGVYRAAHLVDGRIEACLFVSQRQDLPARAWLAQMFGKDELTPAGPRRPAVRPRARAGRRPGPTVCSCFGVGRNTIRIAIEQHG
jgi:hypothetical protein